MWQLPYSEQNSCNSRALVLLESLSNVSLLSSISYLICHGARVTPAERPHSCKDVVFAACSDMFSEKGVQGPSEAGLFLNDQGIVNSQLPFIEIQYSCSN